jgi:nucleotide-binding universal stress UspA family protein
MFQHCLICTDFSDSLHRLADFVPDLASSGAKRIVFLHTVSAWQGGRAIKVDEGKIAAAKERLSGALKSIPSGVEVKVEVLCGRPTEKILQTIQNYQIDVIFVGTSIRSLLEEKIFGSTSVELAKSAKIPLAVIRPQLITTYTREELSLRCQHLWRYLLIPYNDSEAARYSIEQIKAQTQKHPEIAPKQCMLVWVVDDGGRQEILTQSRLKAAKEKLETVKAELEALGIAVNTEVRQGNPLHEILEAALYFDITSIAIATDPKPNLLSWAAPSCANEILRRSWFPVLYFAPS